MKPRVNVLTLAVDDLEKAMAFYRDGLGLPTRGIFGTQFEHGAVAFFHLRNDLILALFPKASLAHDSKLASAAFSIGQLVKSKQEVDEVIEQARKAGAKVTDPPHDRVWGGYSGYFQDKDAHLWEIVWNPDIAVSD